MSELHGWDLDGTIRPGSLLGEAVMHGVVAGFIDAASFDDPRHPTYAEVDHFVAAITDRPRTDFNELVDHLSDEARDHSYPWALERIDWQSRTGEVIVLSHSPAFLVKAFCRGLGVRMASGSYFHTRNRIFSGYAIQLDKRRHLARHLRRQGLSHLSTAAGDSMSDLPLLEKARHGTVVNPAPDLLEVALKNSWDIINT